MREVIIYTPEVGDMVQKMEGVDPLFDPTPPKGLYRFGERVKIQDIKDSQVFLTSGETLNLSRLKWEKPTTFPYHLEGYWKVYF